MAPIEIFTNPVLVNNVFRTVALGCLVSDGIKI